MRMEPAHLLQAMVEKATYVPHEKALAFGSPGCTLSLLAIKLPFLLLGWAIGPQ